MKIKTITILGNFRVDFTSESHYKKTLEEMGYEVIALQEGEASAETVLANGIRSHCLFYVHTHGWQTPGAITLREVFEELEKLGIPTFAYHLDLWLGLDRQKDMKTDDFWRVKYFFTVDPDMADYMNQLDYMPTGIYVRPGVYGGECTKETQSNWVQPIAFVGAYNYHPEWPYRRELIDFLHKEYGARFRRYGAPAEDQPDAFCLRGRELNKLYSSTKIVVGDSLCPGFKKRGYWSDRVYETTGRNGFIIHPDIAGIEEEFVDGKELRLYKFGDFNQLKSLIDYYLEHNWEREEIRDAGFMRTKGTHTYADRMKQIIDYLEANA